VACIKLNKVLNHTTIEKLINQLQHVYNDSESRERATCILRALKQKEKSFTRHLTTFEQTLLKAEGLNEMMLLRKHFSVTVLM
jgi:vacuolar-type H+-ATPase subunit B/Vma2